MRRFMFHDPSVSLLIPAFMTLLAAVAIMHVFGSLVRNEMKLHDLRRRVKEIQYGQAIKVAKIKGMIDEDAADDVDIIDEDDDAPGHVEEASEPVISQADVEIVEESAPASAA